MNSGRRYILLFSLLCFTLFSVVSQRKVTPVENKTSTMQTVEGKRAAKELLEVKKVRPSLVFGDSIINLDEHQPKDTVTTPKHKYPRLYALTLGVNLWDPFMRAFGQQYGGADVSAELSFHNRYSALLELGLGMADDTPDGENYTYHTPLSFYAKLGGLYNFMYNGNPDYRFHAGFVAGFSSFKYDIKDVSVASDYWGQTGTFNILGEKATALWGEILLGLKVKIAGPVSMGWNFRYRFVFSCTRNEYSDVWYVPGLGNKDRRLSGSFSVYYTLPLHKSAGEVSSKADEIAQDYEKLPEKESDATNSEK